MGRKRRVIKKRDVESMEKSDELKEVGNIFAYNNQLVGRC